MTLAPRAVVVRRRTELDELVDRHGTRGQAEFFLRSRGRTLAEVQARHDRAAEALAQVGAAVPEQWRRADVERADLDRFLVDPLDVVVVVGQDGLVANVAKYLDGQPVIGVDPEPGVGVVVRHRPGEVRALLPRTAAGTVEHRDLTMVSARLDDGQHLDALNEVFIGHPSHQSARYRLAIGGDRWERQSSSGIIAATGTGATGWCASIVRERGHLPGPLPAPDAPALAWFVREAWPSPGTGTTATEGVFGDGALRLVVESEQLVVFGDGMESDRLVAGWGQEVRIGRSERRLRLVV
jgi:NAD kinase